MKRQKITGVFYHVVILCITHGLSLRRTRPIYLLPAKKLNRFFFLGVELVPFSEGRVDFGPHGLLFLNMIVIKRGRLFYLGIKPIKVIPQIKEGLPVGAPFAFRALRVEAFAHGAVAALIVKFATGAKDFVQSTLDWIVFIESDDPVPFVAPRVEFDNLIKLFAPALKRNRGSAHLAFSVKI